MEELDLLKKAWKKDENAFSQFSENEIYKMLQRRSSSIVKWILIISILEMLLWLLLGLCSHTDEYLAKIKMEDSELLFNVLNYLSYAITLVFIYLFYKNYRNISATSSTRQLMSDIMKTRKTVKWYVGYNLAMAGIGLLLGVFLAFYYNPEIEGFRHMLSDGKHTSVMVVSIAVILFFIGICLALWWLFYRVVYGILLKKLYRNYNELKKIDFE